PDDEPFTHDSDQYDLLFPLPEMDPSMCRDEFIKKFLHDEEMRISALRPRPTPPHRSTVYSEGPIKWSTVNNTTETRLYANIMRKWYDSTSKRYSKKSIRSSELHAERLSQMMELNVQCQKAAIEFMSVRLLRQLRLFSSPWPGKLDEMPYRLFSWSLDHFLQRLDHNQMYLDVIHRERTTEDLDCLKFRTDLHEIMLLIYEIREDFSDNNDLCDNSIQLLREASYNLNGDWIQGLVENRAIRDKLKASILLDSSSSANLKITRLTAVRGEFEDVTALDPIELRYRFNWLNSCADQRMMRLNGREEELAKQLKDLEDIIYKDELVQNQAENIYSLQVDDLRERLNEWQMRFENDLENAEVECTVARLALSKVNDDHKFYTEQEQMYKRRIAEEREIMATEEKIRRDKQVG
ncbi:hypothetical protein KR038_005372, partial [Drosophila bunnanda]